MQFIQKPVSAWGRLNKDAHRVHYPNDVPTLKKLFKTTSGPFLPYGMGKSYGDVCLNKEALLLNTRLLNHFIHFDENTGALTCEAGILLKEIEDYFIPRGWALPVTPGTRLITVGGAIANDVHGKSHHVSGTFGAQVLSLSLLRSDGQLLECSIYENPDFFLATIGGLGLTGLITEATLQLEKIPSPYLETENIPFQNLDEFFTLSQNSSSWTHTVAWIDCLNPTGRGIFMRGKFSEKKGKPPVSLSLSVPIEPPFSLVNRFSLKAFNQAYYYLQKIKNGTRLMHYVPFFYPLDNVSDWNRLYGPKGFYQYQSVVPLEGAKEATTLMLRAIAQANAGSFLAVLKSFGAAESMGMLSFPQEGVTLALDFSNQGEKTKKLFANLDAIVRDAKGRLYPAKDARMPRDLFEAGYPQLNTFAKYRDRGFASAFSRRLMGS